ncbi:MAG: hypothetical protein Ct9H90mP7_4640 [Candidatus Neomarinimicrobiota bacterium]|nr:MAG: hypothetical protein Ct9H90mP7_4640 [Candidatus Neomarinimicrobiota bacterium]
MVSHDIEDAMYMANKVLILNDGVVEQIDLPSKIFNLPSSSYVARLFGKTTFSIDDFSYIKNHFFDKDRNEEVVSVRPHEFKLNDSNPSSKNPKLRERSYQLMRLVLFMRS